MSSKPNGAMVATDARKAVRAKLVAKAPNPTGRSQSVIDNVVVPILVREFVELLRSDKRVEVASQPVTPYTLANTALAEKVAI